MVATYKVLVSLFNGMFAIMAYFMPKSSLSKDSSGAI